MAGLDAHGVAQRSRTSCNFPAPAKANGLLAKDRRGNEIVPDAKLAEAIVCRRLAYARRRGTSRRRRRRTAHQSERGELPTPSSRSRRPPITFSGEAWMDLTAGGAGYEHRAEILCRPASGALSELRLLAARPLPADVAWELDNGQPVTVERITAPSPAASSTSADCCRPAQRPRRIPTPSPATADRPFSYSRGLAQRRPGRRRGQSPLAPRRRNLASLGHLPRSRRPSRRRPPRRLAGVRAAEPSLDARRPTSGTRLLPPRRRPRHGARVSPDVHRLSRGQGRRCHPRRRWLALRRRDATIRRRHAEPPHRLPDRSSPTGRRATHRSARRLIHFDRGRRPTSRHGASGPTPAPSTFRVPGAPRLQTLTVALERKVAPLDRDASIAPALPRTSFPVLRGEWTLRWPAAYNAMPLAANQRGVNADAEPADWLARLGGPLSGHGGQRWYDGMLLAHVDAASPIIPASTTGVAAPGGWSIRHAIVCRSTRAGRTPSRQRPSKPTGTSRGSSPRSPPRGSGPDRAVRSPC